MDVLVNQGEDDDVETGNPLIGSLQGVVGRRTSLSSLHESATDDEGNDELTANLLSQGYLRSYEGIAKSLSQMNPLLSMHIEKLNILVKIMYAEKANESRNTTLRALLLDILNNSMKVDKLFTR
jgi:hypothetical protein